MNTYIYFYCKNSKTCSEIHMAIYATSSTKGSKTLFNIYILWMIPKSTTMIIFPHKPSICFSVILLLVLFVWLQCLEFPGETDKCIFWPRSVYNLSVYLWKYCYEQRSKWCYYIQFNFFFPLCASRTYANSPLRGNILRQFFGAVLLEL